MQQACVADGSEFGRSSEHTHVRWNRVFTYYGLVYAITYGLVGGFLALGGSFRDPSWVFFAQVSSLTPALVAMALVRWRWREPLVATLGLKLPRNRWLFIGYALPWLLVVLALGLGLAVPSVHWDGSLQPAVDKTLVSSGQLELLRRMAASVSLPTVLLLIPMGLLSSVTMSFFAGCGEEIGWRGLLHVELRPLGFWRNAFVTGVLWLLWHMPLLALGYAYPNHAVAGIGLLTLHVMISSVGAAYLRERAASSTLVGLFHGTTEAAALLAVAPLAGGSEISVGIGSLTWIAADALVVGLLLAYDAFVAKDSIAWSGLRRGRIEPIEPQPG